MPLPRSRPARVAVVGALLCVLFVLVPGSAALAQGAEQPGVSDLGEVITNIRNWLVGLLVALATLLLTIGGLRYL
ncbi:hypothetical protein LP52_25270, partial [Streptomonospora alba]